MQKLSNEKALTFIDSFLTKITVEKTAEESPINATSKETGGEPAGTVPAKVAGTTDTSPGKTLHEKKPAEGLFGKEKSGDLDGIAGTNVEDPAAENNVNADAPHAATGDFGAASVDELKQKKVAEELTMINEFKRAQNLGNKILGKYAAQLEQAATPAVDDADALLKQAAEEAYHDFVLSYQAGILKRAQDEAAIQDALGVSPEEASGLLDEVAMEDPNAVLPAEEGALEEMPDEGGVDEIPATGNEPDADEDAILQALVEAGVTPEELGQASDEVSTEGGEVGEGEGDEDAILQALVEAGITPEELAEVAGEGDAGGMEVEAQEKLAAGEKVWINEALLAERKAQAPMQRLKDFLLLKKLRDAQAAHKGAKAAIPGGTAGRYTQEEFETATKAAKGTGKTRNKEALKALGTHVAAPAAVAGGGVAAHQAAKKDSKERSKEAAEKLASSMWINEALLAERKAQAPMQRLKDFLLLKKLRDAQAVRKGAVAMHPAGMPGRYTEEQLAEATKAVSEASKARNMEALKALGTHVAAPGALAGGGYAGYEALKEAAEQSERHELLKDIVRLSR